MTILSVEPRGMGVLPMLSSEVTRQLTERLPLGAEAEEPGFFETYGTSIAAGAGGLAVGVLLAILIKRKKGRGKRKR